MCSFWSWMSRILKRFEIRNQFYSCGSVLMGRSVDFILIINTIAKILLWKKTQGRFLVKLFNKCRKYENNRKTTLIWEPNKKKKWSGQHNHCQMTPSKDATKIKWSVNEIEQHNLSFPVWSHFSLWRSCGLIILILLLSSIWKVISALAPFPLLYSDFDVITFEMYLLTVPTPC